MTNKIEILKDFYFIERGFLNGNHFVFRLQAPVLIDTAYISCWEETQKHFDELSVNLKNTSLIINTHTHCDHIGGNKIIQDISGCDIALHKIGKYFVDTKDDWSTWSKYFDQKAEFFNCTKAFEDEDIIDIGPYEFQVIHTPGHASDGIVLYNKKEKILLSSDTLWENDMALINLRIEGSASLFHLQESLKKIESLDVNMIYPGHGKPFFDLKKALNKTHSRIDRFLIEKEMIGNDLIKKIIVYTLMIKKRYKETDFFSYLMKTNWYQETIDLYFNSEYELKYNEIINGFIKRGVVELKSGYFSTTVKP